MSSKIEILIIDDEQDYCLIMKHYFEVKNYKVSLAFTLADGLAKLREKNPAILFLDNNLPDGEGWDHLDEIIFNHPAIKIHLISAYRNRNQNPVETNIWVWEKPISLNKFDDFF